MAKHYAASIGQAFQYKYSSTETCLGGVALANYQDQIYMAWTGRDHHLNLMASRDGGKTFDTHSKMILPERSYNRPTLAVYQHQLFLSWIDINGHICLMHTNSDGTIFHKLTKYISHETTYSVFFAAFSAMRSENYAGPILAVCNQQLVVAWTGQDQHLNLMRSLDGGHSFDSSTKYTSPESSYSSIERARTLNSPRPGRVIKSYHPGPGLAVYNEHLFMTWISQERLLNLMCATDNSISFESSTKTTIRGQSSHTTPALAIHRGQVILAWSGSNDWNPTLNLLLCPAETPDFNHPGQHIIFNDTSDQAPALLSYHDKIIIAWSGIVNHQINLAAYAC
ncbi:hypothetical protein [Dictyobacter arantiisoli]|uniref:Sialidase domain-containing protein n=1 Tax=Dictyobacter arantiisoli TaxID=2014874 RepID=A0A5A5TBX5_9CHLR|nr:hypothetical protein [Dictyobacter arantiisoli]GCF08434.1 hypothetical protein KDI_19980 [Dictyobacter arantiisoli]